MCRCLQGCWESFWWNCIEERFCYDESIAKYNPDEEGYRTKSSANGVVETHNNNAPVCRQPGALLRHQSCASSKIHEEDYREIQTHGPILAPEIMAVFANSQIFHDHQPKAKPVRQLSPSNSPVETVHQYNSKRDNDSEKLLKRLEEPKDTSIRPSLEINKKIKFTVSGVEDDDEGEELDVVDSLRSTPGHSTETMSSSHTQYDGPGEIVLRPKHGLDVGHPSAMSHLPTLMMNKQLRNVKSMPQFNTSHLPNSSQSNIFVIPDDAAWNRFSMTPEIPSISFSTLPKNYEETPQIEKYHEAQSLYSIQTANTARVTNADYTMPRYFGKGDMFAQSVDNLSSVVAHANSAQQQKMPPKKRIDKSKRLKKLRSDLPPLLIAQQHTKDKMHR